MNILTAFPPFGQIVITSVTSEQAKWPASSISAHRWPAYPWRTTGTTQQDVVTDVGEVAALTGLLLNRTNYAQVALYRSLAGTTFDLCSPNHLLWSHYPRRTPTNGAAESPWSTGAGIALLPNAGEGPDPSAPPAQRLSWSASASLSQLISTGGFNVNNRSVVFSAWLKAGSVPGLTITMRILAGTTIWATQQVVPTGSWQRFTLAGTIGATPATATWSVALRPDGTTGNILVGACQATLDATAPYLGTYETQDLGLVVPPDPYHGRRKMFYELPGGITAWRYTRLRIPAQATLDDLTYFTTGGVTLAPAFGMTIWAGRHQFPRGPEIDDPVLETTFENHSVEVMSLGDKQWSMTLAGGHRSRHMERLFRYLVQLPPGSLMVVAEAIWNPESHPDYVVLDRAYLATCRTYRHRFSYVIPEVLDFSAQFVEAV